MNDSVTGQATGENGLRRYDGKTTRSERPPLHLNVTDTGSYADRVLCMRPWWKLGF